MKRFTVVLVCVFACGFSGTSVVLGQGVPPVPQQPITSPYGDLYQPGPEMEAVQEPARIVIDVNEIAAGLKKFAALATPLKAVDANSESEQRAWVLRRTDNRTQLLRLVEKQFEDEMGFVKRIAGEEKAVKTAKAADDLVTARKKRYELINLELREQRRQTLLESRDTMASSRGRGSMGRSSRGGRSSIAGGYPGTTAQDAYGTSQTRSSRRPPAAEPNEPAIDPNSQGQIDAWLNATPENKPDLLNAVHELDIIEYVALSKVAEEEKADKTGVAIMALLMVREERIASIEQRWVEEEERMQRIQDRAGTTLQPGMPTGRGTRRGGR